MSRRSTAWTTAASSSRSTPGRSRSTTCPLTVVLRAKTEKGDILQVGENGIWYVLNGLGEGGSISRGEPSEERLALVKREALELALYTFRYVDGVDHVVTLLPPTPPEKAGKSDSASSSAAADSETTTTTTTDALNEKPLPAMMFRPEQLQTAARAAAGAHAGPAHAEAEGAQAA